MNINISIDHLELLDMLLDRLAYWGRDYERELWSEYFEDNLLSGCYSSDFNVLKIVDNEIFTTMIIDLYDLTDEQREKLIDIYNKDRDISNIDFIKEKFGRYDLIVAYDKDTDRMMLY